MLFLVTSIYCWDHVKYTDQHYYSHRNDKERLTLNPGNRDSIKSLNQRLNLKKVGTDRMNE